MVNIESLDIKYDGEYLITDIDDCLIYTTPSIMRHRIKKRAFWFDADLYNEFKDSVLITAKLTAWGKEFKRLVDDGVITDYLLLTAGEDRTTLICDKFNIDGSRLMEAVPDYLKISYLNGVIVPCIYVDDKRYVIDSVVSSNVRCVMYPNSYPFGT